MKKQFLMFFFDKPIIIYALSQVFQWLTIEKQ